MSDLIFDISNLMTPKIREKFSSCSDIKEQIKLLMDLVEFPHCFPEEAEEILAFYQTQTGEDYEEPYITTDNRALLYEFGMTFKDFRALKHLINSLCDEDTREDAALEAAYKLHCYKEQQKKKAAEYAEKNKTVYENIDFKTPTSKDNKPTHTKKPLLGLFEKHAKLFHKK